MLFAFSVGACALAAASETAEKAQDATWQRELQFLESRQARDPEDYHAPTGLGYAYIQHARLTGDVSFYVKAEERFKASLALNKANLEAMLALSEVYAALHRFKDAIALVDKVLVAKPMDPPCLGIKGDALLNLGDLDGATKVYADLKKVEDGFYYISRDANLKYMKGDTAGAIDTLKDALAVAPASMPMNSAWCNVQIGQLYFTSGQFDRAQEFYAAALAVVPGYSAALDHQAELLAARENYAEAEKIYLQLIERTPRPDLQQALGDLYLYRGMKEEAKKWHALALAAYIQSMEAGNLQYAHHLAGFYCDSQENPVEALKWARKDFEGRQSCYAYDTVGWALYKNGDYPGAAEQLANALATGIMDAHLYFHAGVVFARAGDFARGKVCAQKALEINPMFEKFHVHR